MQEIQEQVFLWMPKLGIAIVIFFAFWVFAKAVKTLLQKTGTRLNLNQPVLSLLSETAKISLLVFGAITALGTLGVNVSALVAGLGLTGFAVGFALKDTIANLLAGILILVYHPFELSDHIVVSGKEGKVVGIDFRYTTLESKEKKILIPNSLIFATTVTVVKQDQSTQ